MRAIRIDQTGGPDQMTVHDVEVPAPGPGQVRVAVAAAGVNFIDTYHRRGAYPLPLPSGLGLEGAGTVAATGEGVEDVAVGDRVAWAGALGSYAEQALVAADAVVPVPEGIELPVAAATMLQGMTAHYLARSTFPLTGEHTALVHAAAGGVGQLLVQIAARSGARVIATTSSEEKVALAREAGADDVIRYDQQDFGEVLRARDERVDVVYDGVGAATFAAGLTCLRPRGMMVLFGQASGAVEPLDAQVLSRNGSLYLTRPTLGDYTATPEELRWRAGELFDWITADEVHVRVDRTWPLAEAADAHRYLEGRQTKGKLLLIP